MRAANRFRSGLESGARKSEVGGRKSEVRGRKSARLRPPTSDLGCGIRAVAIINNLTSAILMRRHGGKRFDLTPEIVATVRTVAVSEPGVGTLSDIRFDLLPIVLVITDFLTHTADRQQAVQMLDLGLQIENAFCDDQAGSQQLLIERFGEEIIRAGFHSRQIAILSRNRRE